MIRKGPRKQVWMGTLLAGVCLAIISTGCGAGHSTVIMPPLRIEGTVVDGQRQPVANEFIRVGISKHLYVRDIVSAVKGDDAPRSHATAWVEQLHTDGQGRFTYELPERSYIHSVGVLGPIVIGAGKKRNIFLAVAAGDGPSTAFFVNIHKARPEIEHVPGTPEGELTVNAKRGEDEDVVELALTLPTEKASKTPDGGRAGVNWPAYQGGPHSNQYSTLTQIDTDNVDELEQAWVYETGDIAEGNRSQIQCNPLVINGRLYGFTPLQRVFCLDAATGEEIWTFSPYPGEAPPNATAAKRGLAYWTDGDERRLLFTAISKLHAVDADTGELIRSFGDNGTVDLHKGLDRDVSGLHVSATSPGRVYKDLFILGTRVGERNPAAPGHVRAYDVRTGEIRWIFHTIPHPDEYGYETWPPGAWKRTGGANAWAGMSVDPERDIVYIPTGSATYDFYGSDRPGKNLFATSILALDAATGERRWHFQTVHHDLWDRDVPAPPNLVTLTRNGEQVDALAQITKSGFVFVFDRETGTPLFPIEERPVPQDGLPGEELWPTQPFPVKPPPFVRQRLTEDELTNISPEAHEAVLERFRGLRNDGPFTPPSQEGTVIFPGFDGGGEWGGAAFDPETGLLYVNGNEMAWILTMVKQEADEDAPLGVRLYRENCMLCHGETGEAGAVEEQDRMSPLLGIGERSTRSEVRKVIVEGTGFMPSYEFLSDEELDALVDLLFDSEAMAAMGADDGEGAARDQPAAFTHTGYNKFLDPEGYPAVKPPWGVLAAIDLNKGEIAWKISLGEFDELTERGIPPTGAENYGGPVVTAGGVLFIAATKDEKFRAFDKATGEKLWEVRLPAGGYATPTVYAVDGRQYVVIAAGGGKMGTKSGDKYFAFALPERDR